MYSTELDDLMKRKNYRLTKKEYALISPETCSQISRLKYSPFEDCFEMWTYDNYYWKFKVVDQDKQD